MLLDQPSSESKNYFKNMEDSRNREIVSRSWGKFVKIRGKQSYTTQRKNDVPRTLKQRLLEVMYDHLRFSKNWPQLSSCCLLMRIIFS